MNQWFTLGVIHFMLTHLELIAALTALGLGIIAYLDSKYLIKKINRIIRIINTSLPIKEKLAILEDRGIFIKRVEESHIEHNGVLTPKKHCENRIKRVPKTLFKRLKARLKKREVV